MAEPRRRSRRTATEEPPPQRATFGEIGVTGVQVFGGQVSAEFLPELQGVRGRRIYQEMASNDPVIGGLLMAIKTTFRDTEPVVVPGGETAADAEAAAFLDSCIGDMSHSWAAFMSNVVSVFPFGWAWFETVYKARKGPDADPPSLYDDGRIGWRKFAPRSQHTLERWEIGEDGSLRGMHQRRPNSGQTVLLPIEKCLHFKTEDAMGNPEAVSILRTAYLPWYYRKNLQALEGISLERMGAGIPVAELPEGANDTDKTNVERAIRRFKVDEQMGFVLPPGVKLTLAFGGKGNIGSAFENAIVRYRQEILLATLTQLLVLGMDKVGSYALSETHENLLQTALGGWLRSIEDVLNRFAVPRLFALNRFSGLTKLPSISLGQVGKLRLAAFLQALADLTPLGLIDVSAEVKTRVAEVLGLPKPDPDATPPAPQQSGDAPPELADSTGNGTPAAGKEGGAGQAAPFRSTGRAIPSAAGFARGTDAADAAEGDDDQPDWPELERPINRTLLVFLNGQVGRISDAVSAALGDPSGTFWDAERDEASRILTPLLTDTANAGAKAAIDALQAAYGVGVDWGLVNTSAQRWAREHAGELAKGMTDTTRGQVREAVASWVESGDPLPELTKALEKQLNSKVRAELVASTETTRAYASGNVEAWKQSEVISATKWRVAADELTCPICRPLNNKEGSLEKGIGGLFPPAHPRCLPGDMRVTAGGIRAATKRWYDGDMVIIQTASGKRLASTPNHPILTPGGWVAAGLLNVGGDVISSGLSQWAAMSGVAGGDGYHQDMPALIEQVADAFRRSGQVAATEVPTAAEDFHGDGGGSKVAVVWADSLLRDSLNPPLPEHVGQDILGGRDVQPSCLHRLSVSEFGGDRNGPPLGCPMCGGDLFRSLVGGHARPLNALGIGLPPHRNPLLCEALTDHRAGNAKAVSKGVLGLASDVTTHDFGDGQFDASRWHGSGPAVAFDGDANFSQSLDYDVFADAQLAADLCAGASGPVFADQIIRVERNLFHGFVYNLETSGGFYVAEGIITHNCRCWLVPVVRMPKDLK